MQLLDHLIQSGFSYQKDLIKKNQMMSIVERIYGGTFRSEVHCSHCNYVSKSIQPFSTLQLQLEGINTLQESFTKFTSFDILKGSNAYFCEKCKTKRQAKKRMVIEKAPENLIIQFKRFSMNFTRFKPIQRKVGTRI
jgi:ubiquitin carboxyl-terminal hydrolase 36/42